MGGNFFEILVGGTKAGIQCFVVVQWRELVKAGQEVVKITFLFLFGLMYRT